MNNIQIFNHELFGEIRTMTDESGDTFFVGKDVATALGYSKPLNAIAMHVDEDDSLKWGLIDSKGRVQRAIFINESGLYALVLSSKLPQAKAFKHWVTSEVLPQIRKTGGYIPIRNMRTGEMLTDEEVMQAAESIIGRTLTSFNRNADGCITATDIAKAIGVETKDLNSFLRDKKVQKWSRGQYRLTPDYEGRGLAQNRMFIYYSKGGKQKESTYLVWTPKGAEMIAEMMRNEKQFKNN